MAKGAKKVDNGETSNPEAEERKRLKKRAYSANILSDAPAKSFTPLMPSKTVIKHHGKDILKKSQRKNRYLFSFPGLLAPISGGKIGDLTNLGSKNPILYLDFPQGRMKLFGTIVYPKNRYLTLQFSKGGKNATCDDYFDTMIIFSDACWIGRKDENPGEVRLDIPVELHEGQQGGCDFQGGAGTTAVKGHLPEKVMMMSQEQESSDTDTDAASPERENNLKSSMDVTPMRHSVRLAHKTTNFAEISSEDDDNDSGTGVSGGGEEEAEESQKPYLQAKELPSPDESTPQMIKPATDQISQSAIKSKISSNDSPVPLTQATISTLFKKVEEKMAGRDATWDLSPEVSGDELQQTGRKTAKQITTAKKVKNLISPKKAKCVKPELVKKVTVSLSKTGTTMSSKRKKQDQAEDDDDIEEFSSSSQDQEDVSSDEDWVG